MNKQELYEKDHMEIVDMSTEDLMKFTKKELVKAVRQFAGEAFDWECKLTNMDDARNDDRE